MYVIATIREMKYYEGKKPHFELLIMQTYRNTSRGINFYHDDACA